MASWKLYLAFACMAILSLGMANGLEDRHEEQRERAEDSPIRRLRVQQMLSNVGRDMHRHLHDAQEHRRGMQGPGARHLMRNAAHDEAAMAGMRHPAERDLADKAEMRRAAEEMGKLHHRHMDERTAHAMREAHAAHNSFAAEGGHTDRAAMRHKAAMENMARNVRQDRHLPGHEHLIPEGHMERGPAGVEGARAAAREAHRDALLDDKARFSKERMNDIIKMHPHGMRHGDHVHGDVHPNRGGDRM